MEHRQLLETTEELNLKCETMISELRSNLVQVTAQSTEYDIEAEELIARASGFTLIELELDKVRKKQQDSLYSLGVETERDKVRNAMQEAVRSLVVKRRGCLQGEESAASSKYLVLPKRKSHKFLLCDLILRKSFEHSVPFAFPHQGAALLHLSSSLIIAGGEAGGLYFHQVCEITDSA